MYRSEILRASLTEHKHHYSSPVLSAQPWLSSSAAARISSLLSAVHFATYPMSSSTPDCIPSPILTISVRIVVDNWQLSTTIQTGGTSLKVSLILAISLP